MKNLHLTRFALAGFKFLDQFLSQRQLLDGAKKHNRSGGLVINRRDVGGGIRFKHIELFRLFVPLDSLGNRGIAKSFVDQL